MPPRARLFVLTEGDLIAAVAALYTDGTLMITWCTLEMVEAWVKGLAEAGCQVGRVFAPAYTANKFSELWAHRAGVRRDLGQAERIFQLAMVTHTPPPGRLELATAADATMLHPWFEGFSRETDYGVTGLELDAARDELINRRQLYLWKDPEPRGMAAWVRPTPHGASINFVFVPPEHRGKGLGKAVTASLAKRMIDSGLRFCFILTGAADHRNNYLYQSIGARAVAELVLWRFSPATPVVVTPAGLCFSFPRQS